MHKNPLTDIRLGLETQYQTNKTLKKENKKLRQRNEVLAEHIINIGYKVLNEAQGK